MAHRKPPETVWRPVRDLPLHAQDWGSAHYRERAARWHDVRGRLQDPAVDRTLLDVWLRERNRAFAIETGQIEGLYTLRRGVTEQLIAEGFEGVRAVHAVEPSLSDETLRGLLQDQHDAVELVFETAGGRRPLTHHTLKSWHQLLTRHQEYAPAVRAGRRVGVPLLRGDYKVRPNNPRRFDGVVHEYCPPEQTRGEMDRLLEMHHAHRGRGLPTDVEAAWLHHEFVRIHPFQDGNGRMARLLMACVFARAGECPPIIPLARRAEYILNLEAADRGDLRPFVEFLADLAAMNTRSAITAADDVLRGTYRRRHGNDGVTARDRDGRWRYHPPEMTPRELLILAGREVPAAGERLPPNVRASIGPTAAPRCPGTGAGRVIRPGAASSRSSTTCRAT